MFFQDKYRYNFISTFLLFETKVGCNYVVHWETDQETSRVYRLERDVFISNEADSLFCNTADLGRQEEGERAFFLEKHPVELTEYALGQEVLVSTLFLPPTDTYGDVYLTTFFFFFPLPNLSYSLLAVKPFQFSCFSPTHPFSGKL